MRSHHDEHADALPKVDITSLRHVAYIMDSFIYYIRSREQSGDADGTLKKEDTEMEGSKAPKVESAADKLNNITDSAAKGNHEPKTRLVYKTNAKKWFLSFFNNMWLEKLFF